MKFHPSTAIALLLVSLAGCAQTTFAQDKGTATQRAIAADLRSALSASEWALVKLFNKHGVEEVDWPRSSAFRDPSVSLKFDRSGHIFGEVCNTLNWRYALLEGGSIKVSPDFMTYLACGDAEFMRLEARVVMQVSSAIKAHIDADENLAPRLTLRTSDGSRLVLQGRQAKAN